MSDRSNVKNVEDYLRPRYDAFVNSFEVNPNVVVLDIYAAGVIVRMLGSPCNLEDLLHNGKILGCSVWFGDRLQFLRTTSPSLR